MSKRLFAMALTFILLFAVGCEPSGNSNPSGNGGENGDEFVLKATVNSQTEHHIEVEVIESDYAFGVYWVLTGADTVFLDANGKAIAISDIRAGDIVNITYSGQVMMSYPPQIAAHKIQKV